MIKNEPKLIRDARKFASLLDTPAHMGSVMTLVTHAAERFPMLARPLGAIQQLASWYTDRRTRAFDLRYGTDTFDRLHMHQLTVGANLDEKFKGWKYGPINEDFFQEMMSNVRADLREYTFLDVGCGKGLAVMLAGAYPFKRIIGLDFSRELLDVAKRNLEIFRSAGGQANGVEWVHSDFMKYDLPVEPTLLFLNNPFPEHISMLAVRHIEESLAARPRKAIIVYRRPSRATKVQMELSEQLVLQRKTPYWVIHESVARG